MTRWTRFWYRVMRCVALWRVYWGTEDCDWSSIAIVLRHQVRRTRQHLEHHAIVRDYQRSARQMRIVEVLLTRLLEENYYDIASTRYPDLKDSARWAERVNSLTQQDEEMLLRELRHLREWWD